LKINNFNKVEAKVKKATAKTPTTNAKKKTTK
jgi:hypothetical protein